MSKQQASTSAVDGRPGITGIAPWTAGPFLVGHFDELNGAASRRRTTEISVFEAKMIARHWASCLAQVEASHAMGYSGSWEIRMLPYATQRLSELVDAGLIPPEEHLQLLDRARRLAGLSFSSPDGKSRLGSTAWLSNVNSDERCSAATGQSLWDIRAAVDEAIELEILAERERWYQQASAPTHVTAVQASTAERPLTPALGDTSQVGAKGDRPSEMQPPPPSEDLANSFALPAKWRLFRLDMQRILLPCKGLRIREGMQIIAYARERDSIYPEKQHPQILSYSLPASQVPPKPYSCMQRLQGDAIPRPENASAPMHAIIGDGTPHSYLLASYLSRELSTLANPNGARVDTWRAHKLVASDPWEEPETLDPLAEPPVEGHLGYWIWRRGEKPTKWEPSVWLHPEGGAKVVFYTSYGMHPIAIRRHTDLYSGNGLERESHWEDVGYGPGRT